MCSIHNPPICTHRPPLYKCTLSHTHMHTHTHTHTHAYTWCIHTASPHSNGMRQHVGKRPRVRQAAWTFCDCHTKHHTDSVARRDGSRFVSSLYYMAYMLYIYIYIYAMYIFITNLLYMFMCVHTSKESMVRGYGRSFVVVASLY